MPPKGYKKDPDTGEYVMTDEVKKDEVKKEKLPYYHTVVASIAKSNEADYTRPTVTRDFVDRTLDKYVSMGYELFTAHPAGETRDAITIVYILKLRDD